MWEVELTYHGILGQWVVETYEWRFGDQLISSPRNWWQLRRLQIEPEVPGARAVDLPFGDE